MARLRPGLDDIFFKFKMEHDLDMAALSPEAERICRRLVKFSAASRVWTYSAPGDGGIPSDEKRLLRICGATRHMWSKHSPPALQFFELRDGKYYLVRDWVRIVGGGK
jgi:hypothetical protein